MKNYYEVLQVFPAASPEEIKEAFRFLLFRFHPDHNKGREEWAVQRTMELVEAYHALSDPFKRVHHDVLRTVKIREERSKKGFGLFKGGDKAKLADEAFQFGVLAFKAGEYEKAAQQFARALDLGPEAPNSKFNLAASFLALEKISESLQWLQDLLAKEKDDLEAKALAGKVASLHQKQRPARSSKPG